MGPSSSKDARHGLPAWLPGFIRENFVRKVVAVVFAALVWWSVSNKLGTEETIEGVQVNVSLPKEYALSEDPEKVTVRIRARAAVIKRLYTSDITVEVAFDEAAFSEAKGNTLSANLKPSSVKCPGRITVLEVQPAKIAIKFDRLKTQTVEVRPTITGKPPRGYAVGKVTANPADVILAGPERHVRNIRMIGTRPIVLDETTIDAFDSLVEVQKPFPSATVSPSEILVQVEVVEEYEQRTFRAIPIRVLEQAGRESFDVRLVNVPHVEITVGGPKDAVNALKANQIKAFVDVSIFENPGAYMAPVDCWLSNAVTLEVKNISPSQIQITMEHKTKVAEGKP
jgi:YbbR domain-containing protein